MTDFRPLPFGATLGEFARGWRVLLLAGVGVGTSVSVLLLYGFGALVVPLEQAFGWSRADLQLTTSFIAAGGALATQLVGWLNLRWGMRAVSAVSLVALSLGFLSLILLDGSIGWLYLAYFLLPFAGVGTTPVTWTQLVSLWFVRHRGLALSLILCGSGVAAAALPPLLTAVVGRWDWRAAFVLLALLPVALTLPLAWCHLSPPSEGPGAAAGLITPGGSRASDGMPFAQALRSRRFWTCNLALGLIVTVVVGMVTNIVPMLRDKGLSAEVASSVFSAFGLSLILGRIAVGTLIDRFWAPGVAAVALALPSLGCLIFLVAPDDVPLWLLVAATALVGAGAGAEFDVAAYLVARYFGLRDYGRLFGLHLGLVTVGSALAPFAFAAMLRASGSYDALLAFCIVCCIIGPALLLTLGSYPRSARSPGCAPGMQGTVPKGS